MKTKQIIAGLLAVAALSLASCGEVDDSSSKKSKSAAESSSSAVESSSQAERTTEEDSTSEEDSRPVEKVTEPEESSEPDSEPEQTNPDKDAPAAQSMDTLDFFENNAEGFYAGNNTNAIDTILAAGGVVGAQTEMLGEKPLATGIYCETYCTKIENGVDILGTKFYSLYIDEGIDDKQVYTVSFHGDADPNSDKEPSLTAQECKQGYDKLYELIKERYGEPVKTFTPENDDFFGALWTDLPCGEIWLAWGENLFGAETYDDLILSFSAKGVNGV